VGNRLSEQRPGSSTSYTYDARDRLLAAGGLSYAYDENGNEVAAGSRTFTYDLENRLRSTTQAGMATTYAYDGDGVRLRASTGSQANRTTELLWDGNGSLPQIASERDGNGKLLRRYVYGVRRISQTAGNSTSYFAYDGLGSVASLTSATGGMQWTWSYEPFGAVRSETKASGNQPASSMRFAGEYLDPTGLYHLRARQYDPAAGRFLRPDPAGQSSNESAISGYAYAGDRPTVMVDPSGEMFVPADDGQAWAWFAGSLVDWTAPGLRCQSSLCGRGPRPVLRVHPIPRGVSTWGGALIHPTSGLPGYPALDFGGARGTPVLAVEAGYVRELGCADVGDALYLRGSSGVDYWYGHIRRSVSKSQAVRRGQVIGRTVRHFNGDHLHLGANANYGARIVGRQRVGTDDPTASSWKRGVAIMREISRASRVR